LDEAAAGAIAALASVVTAVVIGTTPVAMHVTGRTGSSFTPPVVACRLKILLHYIHLMACIPGYPGNVM